MQDSSVEMRLQSVERTGRWMKAAQPVLLATGAVTAVLMLATVADWWQIRRVIEFRLLVALTLLVVIISLLWGIATVWLTYRLRVLGREMRDKGILPK